MTVALVHKLLDVRFSDRKRQVVGQHLLQLVKRYEVSLALVEESEALSALLFFELTTPSNAHACLHRLEVNVLSLVNVRVYAADFVVDFFLSLGVEAEVVEDVAKVRLRNIALVFGVVV